MTNKHIDPVTGEVLSDQISSTLATWPTFVQGLSAAEEMQARAKIAMKLSQAYSEIERVLHDDRNTEHKYSYASAETIYRTCRNGLTKVGLAIVPIMGNYLDIPILKKDNSGERRGAYLLVDFNFCLIDSETGYTIVIPWRGEVMEYGDKAFNKAATNATKYMLRTLFLLPTDREEDADRHSPTDRPSTRYEKRKEPERTANDEALEAKSHRVKFATEFMRKHGLDLDRINLKKFKETAELYGLEVMETFYNFCMARPDLKTWPDYIQLLEEYNQSKTMMEGKEPSESLPPTKSESCEPGPEPKPSDAQTKSKSAKEAAPTTGTRQESEPEKPTAANSSESFIQACERLSKAVRLSPDKLLIARRANAVTFTVEELVAETISNFPRGGVAQLYATLERLEKSLAEDK